MSKAVLAVLWLIATGSESQVLRLRRIRLQSRQEIDMISYLCSMDEKFPQFEFRDLGTCAILFE